MQVFSIVGQDCLFTKSVVACAPFQCCVKVRTALNTMTDD